MPRNPWLAIDGAMPPATRARELRRVWDEFLGHPLSTRGLLAWGGWP
jgi:hypothetical protein